MEMLLKREQKDARINDLLCRFQENKNVQYVQHTIVIRVRGEIAVYCKFVANQYLAFANNLKASFCHVPCTFQTGFTFRLTERKSFFFFFFCYSSLLRK